MRNIRRIVFFIILLIFIPAFVSAIAAFLQYPLKTYKRITMYPDDSYTRSHGLPYYNRHTGVDYNTEKGEAIYSAAEGEVVYTRDGTPNGCEMTPSQKKNYGYGNYVIIKHPNGLYTLYGHLIKGGVKVKNGDKLKAGDLVGLAGNSGWTVGHDECGTFLHLHFEVRSENHYGSFINPYNTDNGCLFLGGCGNPQLPTGSPSNPISNPTSSHSSDPPPPQPTSTFPLAHIGWLDAHTHEPHSTHIATAGFGRSSSDGIYLETDSPDQDIHYFWGWNGNPVYKDHALSHLFYIAGHGKKVVAQTSGKFDGGKKYLAVAYQGSDLVYFYYNNQRVGVLDTHGGRPQITELATGDVDHDGKDELFVATSSDDHIYMFDNWHKLGTIGFTLDKIERNWLDAHGGNPTISALACMDIDSNGYDELLIGTSSDDHIYEYFYVGTFSRGRRTEVNFVKQGYVNGVENGTSTQAMTSGKFKGPDGIRDYLAVLTGKNKAYFYWERDLGKAWGNILRKNGFISAPDGKPLIDLAAGEVSRSEGEELILASKDNDHINFFGHDLVLGGGNFDENPFDAKLVSKSDEKVLMRPNEEKELWIEYQNAGEAFWLKDSLDTPDLVTDQPLKRNSTFTSSSWLEQWKPQTLQHETKPNEKIKYQFKIKAPKISGKFEEVYALYNGQENNLYKNSKTSFDIVVDGEPPTKAENLRGDSQNSHWNGIATNDSTPSFLWNEAQDALSGIDGYFAAIDDATPDGQKNLDEWVGNKTSWTSPQALSEGNHTFAVTSKDKLGNINPENTNKLGDAPYLQFLVDLSPPSAPQNLTPKTSSSSWYENITNDSTPTFTWQEGNDQYSGIDGYLVSIDDTQFSNEGALDWETSNTEFTLPQELSEGNHTIYIASTDKVGHISNYISYSFTVDRKGPEGQINFSPPNQYTNTQQIILNLKARDTSPIIEYKLSNDGINWVSFTLSDSQKEFSATQSWSLISTDGRKNVYVKYKDIFGQWSNVATNNIFLDRTNPISWINGLPLFQNTLSFLVSWTGDDLLSGIRWFDVQVKNSLENTWVDWLTHTSLASAVFNGIDGITYYFRSKATDLAGNTEDYPENEDTKTIIDTTAPNPPAINLPERNSTLNGSVDQNQEEDGIQVTVEGEGEANATLTLKIQSDVTQIYNTRVSAQGTWSITNVTLYEGKNILEAKATDDAGNFNITGNYFVWLDTIAPAKISDLTISDVTYNSIALSWTAPGDDENLGTAKSYDLRYSKNPIVSNTDFENATQILSPPPPESAGTHQDFTVENLEPKETYYFAIKTKDDAENWSEVSNVPEASTPTSAYRIELSSSKTTLEAEGIEKATLTATIYDQDGETGLKLSGEPVTFAITDDNGIPTETGNLTPITDNGNGTYTAIYTSATKVGDGKITITAENQPCAFQKQDSIDINLIPGAPNGTILLTPNPASLPANGTSTSTITSGTIFDKTQNVVANGEKITVSTNLGTIISPDQDLTMPGIQVLTTNGVIQFTLKSTVWNGYGSAETQAQISAQSVRGSASGSTQITFRDVTAPSPPQITEPSSGTISNDNTPTIKGRAEKNSRVLIYKNGTYHYYTYADSRGNFAYTFGSALSDGDWNFQTKARDAAGNTSNFSNTIDYTIDTKPPQILDFAPEGTIYHRHEEIFATYQDNTGGTGIDTSKITMKIDRNSVPAQVTSNKISYQNTFPDKNDTYNVFVTVTDKAGNIANASWTFNVQIVSYFKSKIDTNHKVFRIYPWHWPDQQVVTEPPAPSGWKNLNFNDSSWPQPKTPNNPPTRQDMGDAEWLWVDSNIKWSETMLLRFTFNLPNVPGLTITDAAIRIGCDDKSWSYISASANGQLFAQVEVPDSPKIFGLTSFLKPGKNVLATQVSNVKWDPNAQENNAGYAYDMTIRYHD